ncbi:MAG TPA: riboflavin synthase [Bacteroidia bacterium]|nr:riboflavin synthase [Bacteroidia bacterium]
MFTGIVEATGRIEKIRNEKGNVHFSLSCPFLAELKIDQSVAHNGVCLTVAGIDETSYIVTAVTETLRKTNLGVLKEGDEVNLERCMRVGDRLDGHIVQGHVDTTGVCEEVRDDNGSTIFTFSYEKEKGITVEKGSVCVNGVSLTVIDSAPGKFSVTIIPYTFSHTTFRNLGKGDKVNLEFDIVGKYIAALASR